MTATFDPALCDRLCQHLRYVAGNISYKCDSCDCRECADCECSLRHAERDRYTQSADQLEAAGAEVERLRGCMATAGLQCFTRGGSPEQVAAHVRSVVESWTSNDAKLTAERDALRAEVGRLKGGR